jgi:hypothetical protein
VQRHAIRLSQQCGGSSLIISFIDEVHKKVNIYLLISEEYRLLDTRVCFAYNKEIQMHLCIKVVKTFPYLTLRKFSFEIKESSLSDTRCCVTTLL